MNSPHLQSLLLTENGTLQMQIVNVDIEKYSKRNSLSQLAVINTLTNLIRQTIRQTGELAGDSCSSDEFDIRSDLIIIPTGDGAILAFSDGDLSSIHLTFAKMLLKSAHRYREEHPCPKFAKNGWCNCHDTINVRIGISNGETILFRDINHNYNVAGRAINIAARIKKHIDSNQIALTEKAYRRLVESGCNCVRKDTFLKFEDVTVKHGELVTIYIYSGGPEDTYINKAIPDKLKKGRRVGPPKLTA